MEVFEITGNVTGISRAGVNFLQPSDSYQSLENGFVYRQVLQSRKGIDLFAPRLTNETRVMCIYEFIKPDGTKELLAFDTNDMYLWTAGTFVKVPFGGSMDPLGPDPYAGFAIANRDEYISVAPYPTETNSARLIICGLGIAANAAGSAIFFYNGTDIRDFTAVADNPNYVQPTDGTLTRSKYCIFMNARINFVVPTIGGNQKNQGILYSGINNSAGDGNKFNVSSSGIRVLDTQEVIKGVERLGEFMILNCQRSNWLLEITQNAFKPWYSRKIPSVLGTDADFSSVAWHDSDKSVGKTGLISTDGRESVRFDNKIPYLTQNEFDQEEFNLTYGGFDRTNNQFLWSYLSSPSDNVTQDKVLIYNYEESSWAIYDLRLTVFGQTDIGINLTWDEIDDVVTPGNPSWKYWDTTEELWDKIGVEAETQKTLAGDDLGFIYSLNADGDDYVTAISAITNATSAVLTVEPSAFLPGDLVVIENVEGMVNPENPDDSINNFDSENPTYQDFTPYLVTAATPTSITVNKDTSTFSAATINTGTISKVISFSAKTIPFNPWRDKGLRCYVSFIEILINTNGGFLEVDLFADEEEQPYRSGLKAIPDANNEKERQWISISVNHEAEFHAFRFRQFSPAVQVQITSVRIHCEPGGSTSG